MSQNSSFNGKSMRVTGACGTVGCEMVRQLAAAGDERIACLDYNKSELFFLQEHYRANAAVEAYLADICDGESPRLRMDGIEIVLHAAAFRHEVLCEESLARKCTRS